MEAALERLEQEEKKTADKATILDFLSFSYSQFGSLRKALNLTNEWLNLGT
jgi:prolyl 4-hydroxylase